MNGRKKVEANLFPASRPAVDPWEHFRWHLDDRKQCDTWKPHSSQALAIDVFGWIKSVEQGDRNVICNLIAKHLNLPPADDWQVELEWIDPDNRLNEHPEHQTQVDSLLVSSTAIIACECKFCESTGGPCSQAQPLRIGSKAGIAQCSGNYVDQINPVNGKQSRCSLTAKGIRYWSVLPNVLDIDLEADYLPCPFAGPSYQWMRNIAVSSSLAATAGLKAGVLVVYADSGELPFAQMIRNDANLGIRHLIRPSELAFGVISFQHLLQSAILQLRQTGSGEADCHSLITWVDDKIARASKMVAAKRQSNSSSKQII